MRFFPRFVAALFELDVLKMRNESLQKIARGGAGMRVPITMKHQHWT
jgi:hypothetical protein